jgi:hypothetical protein
VVFGQQLIDTIIFDSNCGLIDESDSWTIWSLNNQITWNTRLPRGPVNIAAGGSVNYPEVTYDGQYRTLDKSGNIGGCTDFRSGDVACRVPFPCPP